MTRTLHSRLLALWAFCLMQGGLTHARAQSSDDVLDQLEDTRPPKAAGQAPVEPSASSSESVLEGSESPSKQDGGEPHAAALDRIKAVPRKALLKRHRFELSPSAMVSMNDAYYQHFAIGGSLIFYPHDAFGLGVGGEYLLLHAETDNVEAMSKNFIAVPAPFEQPWLFAHLDAYWVPLYGKMSLFAADIVHFDMYATAGLGAAFAGEHRRPAINIGIGQRFVLGEWLALRFEVRDHLFIDTQTVNNLVRSDVQNFLLLQVGVSVFVPPTFDYTYE